MIPREIIGGELFGQENGSCTGAFAPVDGKFEASTGTVSLDEGGAMDSITFGSVVAVFIPNIKTWDVADAAEADASGDVADASTSPASGFRSKNLQLGEVVAAPVVVVEQQTSCVTSRDRGGFQHGVTDILGHRKEFFLLLHSFRQIRTSSLIMRQEVSEIGTSRDTLACPS